MGQVLERLRESARAQPRRVIFPEPADPRVPTAAAKFGKLGLGEPVLLTATDAAPPPSVSVISMQDQKLRAQVADEYFQLRAAKGMTESQAREAITDPLLFAALLVRLGVVDACVAGSVATTADVLRAAIRGVGPEPGRRLVSSFFLMELRDRVLTYSDCGVVPAPNAEELGEIAVTAAASHQRLTGETPKVAMLAFSTKGSAQHPSLDRIVAATEHARKLNPELAIDGELQFDAALLPQVAAKKAPGSSVAGVANVFIFPDLNAGNIAYKITERLAGATALGPLLQGLAKPCMDLSRGCTSDDIVDVAVIAANLA